MNGRCLILTLCAVLFLGLGVTCGGSQRAPEVVLGLNGIDPALSEVLVVPPSGFVITADFIEQADGASVDPATISVTAERLGFGDLRDLGGLFVADAAGAHAIVPPEQALPPGTWVLRALVQDVEGTLSDVEEMSFAVRDFPGGSPPIGTGQILWLDFESDRDAVPGADFPVDLQIFGLGSPLAPALSADVEDRVVAAVLDRVALAYFDVDPIGLGSPDPIDVLFVAQDPGAGDVTRICVGGQAPQGPNVLGSILIDPQNQNRTSVECATIPPTGIFPQGMFVWSGGGLFQDTFDPLRTETGGTPIGEHPLDPTVLDEAFDPVGAGAEELARFTVIEDAIRVFSNALGSLIAHEAAHALGSVEPGPPGRGVFGGESGGNFSHNVDPDGSVPAENFLMKAGSTFNFARLAGENGNPLPFFRATDHAYLRDRMVIDPSVTALLPPPRLESFTPGVIDSSVTAVTVTGRDFAATPSVRLVNEIFTYNVVGEALLEPAPCGESCTLTGLIILSQIPSGLYEVEVENPDGQLQVDPEPTIVFVP